MVSKILRLFLRTNNEQHETEVFSVWRVEFYGWHRATQRSWAIYRYNLRTRVRLNCNITLIIFLLHIRDAETGVHFPVSVELLYMHTKAECCVIDAKLFMEFIVLNAMIFGRHIILFV